MRGRFFVFCNIVLVLLVAAAVPFVPVAACRAAYESARASCDASIFDALRQLHVQKNGIFFSVCGEPPRIALTFLAAVGAAVCGAARKGAVLSVVLYIAAVLLSAGCVSIGQTSAQYAGEGLTEHTGFSRYIFAEVGAFALVFAVQRLLLYGRADR